MEIDSDFLVRDLPFALCVSSFCASPRTSPAIPLRLIPRRGGCDRLTGSLAIARSASSAAAADGTGHRRR